MSLGNIFQDINENTLNTLFIFIIVLLIIFGFGKPEICGYSFGCFNPSEIQPTAVSPAEAAESARRSRRSRRRSRRSCRRSCRKSHRSCCDPCCRPCNPCGNPCGGILGGFGSNKLFFIILIIAFIFILGCKNKKKDECCDED